MAKASTPPATGKKIELADVNQTLLEQNKTLGNTNSLIKKMVDFITHKIIPQLIYLKV